MSTCASASSCVGVGIGPLAFDGHGRRLVHHGKAVQPLDEGGDAVGADTVVDGGMHQIGEEVAAFEEQVDAAFGKRHPLLAQQVEEILELVRDVLERL